MKARRWIRSNRPAGLEGEAAESEVEEGLGGGFAVLLGSAPVRFVDVSDGDDVDAHAGFLRPASVLDGVEREAAGRGGGGAVGRGSGAQWWGAERDVRLGIGAAT